MIKDSSVQEVLQTARIEDVVGDFVNLKRRGANLIGLCPFHGEKTPSFNVNPARNIYKCFGCGKAGDPVQFLREHDSLSFVEAIKWIARKYGIQLEEVEVSQEIMEERRVIDGLYLVNEYAKKYFQEQLFEHETGKAVGLSYFKERGFREDLIKKFGLGFTQTQRDHFYQRATADGYKPETLEKLGLIRDQRDFFRGRVMFTIHNLSGKPVAFAGRILRKDAKAPKYINSPETEIYNKSKTLYGLYFAKTAIRKHDEAILVEGYTDVLSLHQAGVENAVASSGTSLTVEQTQLIRRFTDNVKILYDGDAAGVKAALRGLDLLLEQNLNVRIVLLPEGEDPDSYVQKLGTTKFEAYLDAEAKDFILFKTNLLLADAQGDPLKKAELVRDIVGSIARVPDAIKRDVYVRECARLLEVDASTLFSEIDRTRQINAQKDRQAKYRAERRARAHTERNQPRSSGASGGPRRVDAPPGPGDEAPLPGVAPTDTPVAAPRPSRLSDEFQERDIVRLLVEFGDKIYDQEDHLTVAEYILGNIEDVMDAFDHPLYERMVRFAFERVAAQQPLVSTDFTSNRDAEIAVAAAHLLERPHELSEGWKRRDIELTTQLARDENYRADSKSAVLRFRLKKVDKMIQSNLSKLQEDTDEAAAVKIMRIHGELQELRNEMGAELKTIVYR